MAQHTIHPGDTATATVILRNAKGEAFTFAVTINPHHPGLHAMMNRAARATPQKATIAGGAVKVLVLSQQKPVEGILPPLGRATPLTEAQVIAEAKKIYAAPSSSGLGSVIDAIKFIRLHLDLGLGDAKRFFDTKVRS